MEALLTSPVIQVIPQSRESFRAGRQLYGARPDKRYSLVDCISMETMRKEGFREVLTNDRHFEQEGFRPLFRSKATWDSVGLNRGRGAPLLHRRVADRIGEPQGRRCRW